jgi:hypothetical protein
MAAKSPRTSSTDASYLLSAGEGQVAIHRLLRQGAFDDVAVKALTEAYDAALRELGLANRADPLAQIMAVQIIEIARMGEHDPTRLRELAIRELRQDEQLMSKTRTTAR